MLVQTWLIICIGENVDLQKLTLILKHLKFYITGESPSLRQSDL